MSKYGYIVRERESEYFVEELKSLVDNECEDIFIEKYESNKYHSPELQRLFNRVKKNDSIILPNMSKIYMERLENESLILSLKQKNITIIVLNGYERKVCFKNDGVVQLNLNYILTEIRNKQDKYKLMGRPKVPQNKIDQVIDYRVKDQLTYREISELTGLSLGTVYKYFRQYENKKVN